MNKSNIASFYVPKEDHKIWDEAEILAKALGISRGKLICLLLRKVINDPKTEISIPYLLESLDARRREVLHNLFDRLASTERPADTTDVNR